MNVCTLPDSLRSVCRWPRLAGALLSAGMAVCVGPVWAQFKVVAPDGSVTYTDRPIATGESKVSNMGRRGMAAAAAAPSTLPAELREVVQRYPVTLYTGPDCLPCETGRRLLQGRGVPFNEKKVLSEDDAAVLERAIGARTVPGLTIGTQAMRGFSETDWTAYLDAAGYPRESKLPRGWQGTKAPAAPAAAAAPAPQPPALPAPAQPAPVNPGAAAAPEAKAKPGTTIRF